MNPNPNENIFIVGPPNVYILDAEDNLHLWKDVVEYRSNADNTSFTIETAMVHEPIFDIKSIQLEFKAFVANIDEGYPRKNDESYWLSFHNVRLTKWWPTIGNAEYPTTVMYKFAMED